jgi:integrase
LSSVLRGLAGRAGPKGKLWSFSEQVFLDRFGQGVACLGLDPHTCPYQLRHGAASHAAVVDRMPIDAIQRRLRHQSPVSTKRYEKATRYQAEAARLPASVQQWGLWVDEHLVELLLGSLPPLGPETFGVTSSRSRR